MRSRCVQLVLLGTVLVGVTATLRATQPVAQKADPAQTMLSVLKTGQFVKIRGMIGAITFDLLPDDYVKRRQQAEPEWKVAKVLGVGADHVVVDDGSGRKQWISAPAIVVISEFREPKR